MFKIYGINEEDFTFKGRKAFPYGLEEISSEEVAEAAKNLKNKDVTGYRAFKITKGIWIRDIRPYQSYYGRASTSTIPNQTDIVGAYLVFATTPNHYFYAISSTLGRTLSAATRKIETQVMSELTRLPDDF